MQRRRFRVTARLRRNLRRSARGVRLLAKGDRAWERGRRPGERLAYPAGRRPLEDGQDSLLFREARATGRSADRVRAGVAWRELYGTGLGEGGRRAHLARRRRARRVRRTLGRGAALGRYRLAETQAAVLLHRAGLAASVAEAGRWIRAGKVLRAAPGGAPAALVRPETAVPVGGRLRREPRFWLGTGARSARGHWQAWGTWDGSGSEGTGGRNLPTYAQVSWERGRVSLLRQPAAGDLLVPGRLPLAG